MRSHRRLMYWLFTGALFGLGLSVSFGLPLLALGLLLLFHGLVRMGGRGFWGMLVTLGAVPALTTLYMFLTLEPCPGGAGAPQQPRLCGELPTSYAYSALAFGAIALGGVLWGALDIRMRERSGSTP